MKELSIEDKAKRYDEALQRTRRWYDANTNEGYRAIFEEIFPELQKSEDERIRKALINGFNKLDKSAVWYNGITNGQILAWLEKQNEQKPVIEMKTPEESLGIDSDTYNKIVDECVYELVGQKPAWNKEDETKIKSIIALLKSPALCTMDGNKGIIDESIKYLKSLKDRVQPKQEWSEEDEVKINRIVACLENLNVADNDILLKDVDWLKSLRSQNRWKPSEEQITWLYRAADVSDKDSRMKQVLNELLSDLNKLKD